MVSLAHALAQILTAIKGLETRLTSLDTEVQALKVHHSCAQGWRGALAQLQLPRQHPPWASCHRFATCTSPTAVCCCAPAVAGHCHAVALGGRHRGGAVHGGHGRNDLCSDGTYHVYQVLDGVMRQRGWCEAGAGRGAGTPCGNAPALALPLPREAQPRDLSISCASCIMCTGCFCLLSGSFDPTCLCFAIHFLMRSNFTPVGGRGPG